MSVAIQTRGLTRYFGPEAVVDRLDLTIPTGRVTALLGLNGAGKTTTLRMLMGLLAPTRGNCKLLGTDSSDLQPADLARIGYLVEGHYLPPWMTATQIESFCARSRPRWDSQKYAEILRHFAVRPAQRAGQISRGQRAGVSLASVLAADPELLILDDPSLGLDPVSRRALNETLLDFAAGDHIAAGDLRRVGQAASAPTHHGDETAGEASRTILLSTHQLDDVERIADDVAVMLGGRLWVHADLNTFESRVTRYLLHPTRGNPINNASVQSAVTAAGAGLVESRPHREGIEICVVDAGDAFADAVSKATGGQVACLETTLQDRVIAYLSQHRAERLQTPPGSIPSPPPPPPMVAS